MRFRHSALAAALLVPAPAGPQALPPHAYLPLEHWATPFVEHLIDRGVVRDPSPLVRPWIVSAVVRALTEADSTRLTAPERATLRHVRARLTPPLARVLVTPELTLLRQGEGDFRLPFPGIPEYPTTPTMFAGVVERVYRAALAGTIDLVDHATLEGNAGVHRRMNADHVPGARATDFVGGIIVRLRLGRAFAVE